MKCLFNLYKECRVIKTLAYSETQEAVLRAQELAREFGSEKFIKVYCSMCIKSVYAKSKKQVRLSVVNTL